MRAYTIVIIFFLIHNIYSQTKNELYFLIDKNDTLVKTHTPIKSSYNTYWIYIDEKTLIKKNRTPLEEDRVWVADAKYDYYVNERDYVAFSFFEADDKLISKKYLDSLNVIENRKEFLEIDKLLFNYSIFFIEPIKCNDKYVLREVYPVFYE